MISANKFIPFAFLLTAIVVVESCKKSKNENSDAWLQTGSGNHYDAGRGVATDSLGNVYVVGSLQGQAKFGDVELIGKGDDGIFLLKYDASGNLLWAKQAGGKGDDLGYAIALDKQGNSYITGHFTDSAYFDETAIVSKGAEDVFIAKYTTDGKLLWAKQAGGVEKDFSKAISVDKDGNCFVTGYFMGAMNFDTTRINSSGPSEDIFVAKYTTNGENVWAKSIGNAKENDRGMAIINDNLGNTFVTGYFSGSVVADSINLYCKGKADIFVAKLNPSGTAVWAASAGSQSWDEANGISVNDKGELFVSGLFTNTISFDDKESNTVTSLGQRDIAVLKYSADGKPLFLKSIGTKAIDEGRAVVCDKNGGCYITGFTDGDIAMKDSTIKGLGGTDVVVAHFNNEGNITELSIGGGNDADEGRAITLDAKGKTIVTGKFNNVATFGALKTPTSIETDYFLRKY